MKVLISACAADNGLSGIGHYIESVVEHLASDASVQEHYIVYVENRDNFLDDIDDARFEVRKLSSAFSSVAGNILWHFLILPAIALWSRASVVIFLAANRRLSLIPSVTTIGVVHDLSQLHIVGKYDRFRTFYVLQLLPILMRPPFSRYRRESFDRKRRSVLRESAGCKNISHPQWRRLATLRAADAAGQWRACEI